MRNKRTNLLILFGLCGLLVVLFPLTFLVSFRLLRENEIVEIVSGAFGYQYLKRNNFKNESSFGCVILLQELQESEYISYGDKEGNNILISNFGEVEYECVGTCYCEESERRNNRIFISRGLTYLLVSTSSIIAYQKAEEHFSKACLESISNECDDPSSVRSDVEECSSVIGEKHEDKDEEERIYFCYGKCVRNMKIRIEKTKLAAYAVNCDMLKQEAPVSISKSELIATNSGSSEFLITALNKFRMEYLRDFCKERSEFDFEYKRIIKSNGKLYPYVHHNQGYACVSKNSPLENGNVKCRQVFPKPTSSNTEFYNENWWKEKEIWDDKLVNDQ